MTGTASTEGEEFNKIYELDVVIVPTNKPVIRVDMHDKVYFNQHTKWKFVKDYIKFYHEIGQPILIGTADIATSEYVSQILESKRLDASKSAVYAICKSISPDLEITDLFDII